MQGVLLLCVNDTVALVLVQHLIMIASFASQELWDAIIWCPVASTAVPVQDDITQQSACVVANAAAP